MDQLTRPNTAPLYPSAVSDDSPSPLPSLKTPSFDTLRQNSPHVLEAFLDAPLSEPVVLGDSDDGDDKQKARHVDKIRMHNNTITGLDNNLGCTAEIASNYG